MQALGEAGGGHDNDNERGRALENFGNRFRARFHAANEAAERAALRGRTAAVSRVKTGQRLQARLKHAAKNRARAMSKEEAHAKLTEAPGWFHYFPPWCVAGHAAPPG